MELTVSLFKVATRLKFKVYRMRQDESPNYDQIIVWAQRRSLEANRVKRLHFTKKRYAPLYTVEFMIGLGD